MNPSRKLGGCRVTQLTLALIGILATLFLSTLSFSRRPLSGADKQPVPIGGQPRTPVLVELFTSEGCSSCPPADALLEKLDASQPVSAAELIVLSEHVDYWNDIGWKDPYSSPALSDRQRNYSQRFGLRGVYTPQMVVDGDVEFVGSDERLAIRAVEKVTKGHKIPVRLSSIHHEANHTIALHVEAGPLPSSARESANVLIATADDTAESH
jgi:hypothetical protein